MNLRVRALRLDEAEIAAPRGWARRRWRWLLALAAACAAVILGARAAYLGGLGSDIFSRAREVESVTATSEPSVEVVLDTTGYVAAETVGKVSACIPGTVTEICVEEGQEVTTGQVLGRLDDAQYRADLAQAKAGLAVAKARLEELRKGSRQEEIEQAKAALKQAEAQRDLVVKQHGRADQLKDTIAPAEYDRIQAGHREAEARVEQLAQALRALETGPRREQIAALEAEVERAQALVDKAQDFVSRAELTSPIDGTVVERSVELGQSVLPEAMVSTLFVIADLSRLEAEIDIQEQDVANVRSGQPCVVTTEAYPDRQYSGRLDWLSPVFNRQRGVCRAKVRILQPDAMLMPDMNCRVRVLKEESSDGFQQVVRLPSGAVVRRGDQACVYVLDGQFARRREIQLGRLEAGLAEVQKGIRSGEVVLLPGQQPLADGQRVRLRPQE